MVRPFVVVLPCVLVQVRTTTASYGSQVPIFLTAETAGQANVRHRFTSNPRPTLNAQRGKHPINWRRPRSPWQSRSCMMVRGGELSYDSTKVIARWMLWPSIFSILTWTIALYPEFFLRHIPEPTSIWLLGSSAARVCTNADRRSNTIKHLAPKNVLDGWELGRIAATLEMENPKRRTKNIQSLLERSREILNAPSPMTFEEATRGVGEAARSMTNRRSRLRRLLGLVSFVNVAYCIALAGMGLTVFPTVRWSWRALPNAIKERLRMVWMVISQSAEWMVSVVRPLEEPLLYLVPLYCFCASLRFPLEGGARGQVAALGAVLAGCVFSNSSMGHMNVSDDKFSGEVIYMLLNLWMASFLGPMALASGSNLLGFFTVGAVFGAVGFCAGILPYQLGWFVGFLGKDAMKRSMIASSVVLSLFLGIQATGLREKLEIFQTGAAVFGTMALGLAGLIDSYPLYHEHGLYAQAFVYPAIMLALSFCGSILSYPSLTNTSITFFWLWCTHNYFRFVHITAVSVFVASVALYYLTLWLRLHPEFLGSLFRI